MTWASRQWAIFCELVGGQAGEEAVLDKVFGSLTVIAAPENNDSVYQYTFRDSACTRLAATSTRAPARPR